MRPTIRVTLRYPKEKPDFAFRITGQDFEPFASDGDYLLVSEKQRFTHGDLGIFYINGNYRALRLYCKYGNRKLVPICVDKPEIDFNKANDIIYVGKVINVKRI